ncbi:divergent protein kinase domain 2A [Calliphora vicina]|uniref:divergent protein kinase domain 2A n=1 Tax=Calliphora vicina TaxID=7373 RepID=UPI00325C1E1E
MYTPVPVALGVARADERKKVYFEIIFSSKSTQRQFSHTRFIFLLIIVLNTLDTKDHTTRPQIIHRKHFENDLKYCTKCFVHQIQQCLDIFENIKPDNEFSVRQLLTFLPERSCKRNNQVVKLKNSTKKLITKYLFNTKYEIEKNFETVQLKNQFLAEQENLQGMQYTPLNTIQDFIKDLQKFHKNLTEITIWLYLSNNIQPLILPLLKQQNFAVPETYAVCGFTLYQQYAGEDLYNYFNMDFPLKLEISKQLLQAALKFSHGFNNYRFYITDLTADNIVYDQINNKLYFIDLDTIFIVNSAKSKYHTSIHKHQYIECSGCFAYSADDIASYNISDINVYSACQFLREDLFKDQSKGFLYPIPDKINEAYPKLWQLLNKCVDCPDSVCGERLTVANELIELFEEILQ